MNIADSRSPLLVTDLLHPGAMEYDANFPREMHPEGYVEFIAKHGLGTVCQGLSIHSAPIRDLHWDEAMKEELLVEGIRQWGWSDELLKPEDLKTCMVVADDDNGFSYITCERFGPTIFVLPHDEETIFQIGNSLADLIAYYCQRQSYSYPYFDPWPHCSRRCATGFDVPPDVGFDALLNRFRQEFGLGTEQSSSISHSDYFQDRYVPALRAIVGFYLPEDQPAESRLSHGAIQVRLILDRGSLDALADFKETFTGSREWEWVNHGQGCSEHVSDFDQS